MRTQQNAYACTLRLIISLKLSKEREIQADTGVRRMLPPQNRHPQINRERCCSHPLGSFASLEVDVTNKRERKKILLGDGTFKVRGSSCTGKLEYGFTSGKSSIAKVNLQGSPIDSAPSAESGSPRLSQCQDHCRGKGYNSVLEVSTVLQSNMSSVYEHDIECWKHRTWVQAATCPGAPGW